MDDSVANNVGTLTNYISQCAEKIAAHEKSATAPFSNADFTCVYFNILLRAATKPLMTAKLHFC